MRLPKPLCKLPFRFDVGALTEALRTIKPADWVNHPGGNEASANVILVSTHGEINDDFAAAGSMRTTEALRARPYLSDVLASFRSPISRARLTRLAPGSGIGAHHDANFHWFRRVRIHVPIVTNPAVAFQCGGQWVHMAPGEAWLFDNFRSHSVVNNSAEGRIHLIFDTKGSPWFWRLATQAMRSQRPIRPTFVPVSGRTRYPSMEGHAFDVPLPQEVSRLLADVFKELATFDGSQQQVAHLKGFERKWRQAFARYGVTKRGATTYRVLADELRDYVEADAVFERLDRFGRAYGSLAVLETVFQETNRTVPYRGAPPVKAKGRQGPVSGRRPRRATSPR
jgi:hypothetical protein